jgi:hypothetical protein
MNKTATMNMTDVMMNPNMMDPMRKFASQNVTGSINLLSAQNASALVPPPVGGGSIEDNANFPWVVRLSPGCQGTLIAPKWVLTAAHCHSIGAPLPLVSYTRTNPSTGIVTGGERMSDGLIFHPDYGPNFANDIVLIRLSRPFDPDPLLQPAELSLWPGIPGQVGVLASIIDHLSPLPPGKSAVFRGPIILGGHTFVVRDPTATLCQGDSGSGYTMYGGGKHFVVGVTSKSANAHCDQPIGDDEADMMNVFHYAPWIRSKTGLPAPCCGEMVDILWRSTTDGTLAIWFMYGGLNFAQAYPGVVSNDWVVIDVLHSGSP